MPEPKWRSWANPSGLAIRRLLGVDSSFPENGYRGGYIRDLASEVMQEKGRRASGSAAGGRHDQPLPGDSQSIASSKSIRRRPAPIRGQLRSLVLRDDPSMSAMRSARPLGNWRRWAWSIGRRALSGSPPPSFGDDKDRVLIRETGEPTYFASDVAYHADKFHRGFSLLIDIWGADHHGYIPRLKALVQALGHARLTPFRCFWCSW